MKMSVKKSADRAAMAQQLRAVANTCPGWVCSIEPEHGREIDLEFNGPRGLRLHLDLDGESRQQAGDVWVVSWHMSHEEAFKDTKIAAGFAWSVNEFHWRKATDVANSFDDLLALLKRRFEAATNGSAFQ